MVTGVGVRHTKRPSRRQRARQKGLTLIETVVTLAIISIAVVGIAYGFSAAVRGAGDAQVQAELDAAAQTAAGYLQSDLSYCPCDVVGPACAGGPYSLDGLPLPSDVTSWSLTAVTEFPPQPEPRILGHEVQRGPGRLRGAGDHHSRLERVELSHPRRLEG